MSFVLLVAWATPIRRGGGVFWKSDRLYQTPVPNTAVVGFCLFSFTW